MDPEIKLSKLKPIDYDEMNVITTHYKLKSDLSTEKMNNILNKTKLSKVNCQHIEHKKIWNLESMRLNNLKRKLQRKLNSFVSYKAPIANGDNYIGDLYQFNENILNDHLAFKSNIIDPVWTLCEDIKEWKLKKSRGYKVTDYEPIKELIVSMKHNLHQVSLELKAEEESLVNGLENEIEKYSTVITPENIHDKVGTGIPLDTWEIDCFDKSLLTELLSQFIYVDAHFQAKLDQIETKCNLTNKRDSPDDWSPDEIEFYDHLQDSYLLHGTVNRNMLFKNILKIVFDKHSHKNMAEMEKFIHCKRLMKEKLQSLVADWKHDRAELLVKIKASIIDYNEHVIVAQVESQKIKLQKEICSQLTEQLNDWREKKEQLHALEETLNNELEEKLKIEEEEKLKKETEIRNRTKKMIYQYKFEKKLQIDKQIEEKQRRIEELREYLKNQAIIDEERVKYREQVRQEKIKEEQFRKQQLLEQKNLSEMKINQLIEQVRPNVEFDSERVMKPTSTWLNHTDVNEKSECDSYSICDVNFGHRYAVPLNTYNDKELLANPRLRVENALRDAGLINSDYARNILRSIPTNQPPRKDCLSDFNLLKYD